MVQFLMNLFKGSTPPPPVMPAVIDPPKPSGKTIDEIFNEARRLQLVEQDRRENDPVLYSKSKYFSRIKYATAVRREYTR